MKVWICFLLTAETSPVLWEHSEGHPAQTRLLCRRLLWIGVPLLLAREYWHDCTFCTAAWVMHMSKQMINMFTRAFIFSLIASMGFTRLTPVWVWLVLVELASSTSHPVCLFSLILWKQTVNHSTYFFMCVGFTFRIFYRTDARVVILKKISACSSEPFSLSFTICSLWSLNIVFTVLPCRLLLTSTLFGLKSNPVQ